MRRFLCFCALSALLLTMFSCGGGTPAVTDASGNEINPYTASFEGPFDTVSILSGYAVSKEAFNSFCEEFSDLLWEYHRLYDIYQQYDGLNNLATVNELAGVSPVRVDSRILDLLSYGQEIYTLTDGRTNILYGSVLSLWHDCREAGISDPVHATLPDAPLLSEASLHTGIGSLVLDRDAGTAFLNDSRASLDVGALAKGYATEQVCLEMVRRGYNHFAANIGGNVRTVGTQADGSLWQLGIQNPAEDSDRTPVLRLSVSGMSLVTSGIYQRYYTVDGVRYHHIIDPDTDYPSTYWYSVSVLAPDSGLADALSTALFNLDYAAGAALLAELNGVEAVWIDSLGNVTSTSGIAANRTEGAS